MLLKSKSATMTAAWGDLAALDNLFFRRPSASWLFHLTEIFSATKKRNKIKEHKKEKERKKEKKKKSSGGDVIADDAVHFGRGHFTFSSFFFFFFFFFFLAFCKKKMCHSSSSSVSGILFFILFWTFGPVARGSSPGRPLTLHPSAHSSFYFSFLFFCVFHGRAFRPPPSPDDEKEEMTKKKRNKKELGKAPAGSRLGSSDVALFFFFFFLSSTPFKGFQKRLSMADSGSLLVHT